MTMDTLQQVLKKYGFLTELPETVRKRISKIKPVIFKKILLNVGAREQAGPERRIEAGIRIALTAAALIFVAGAFFAVYNYMADRPVETARTGATVVFLMGDVSVMRDGATLPAPGIHSELREGDVITTGKRSKLVFQVGDTGVVSVLEDSTVSMKALLRGDGDTEVSLARGNVYSRIRKLEKKSYLVRTPTTVASVRGTGFLTSHDDGVTKVSLLEGKVLVTPLERPEGEKLITPHQAALSDRERQVKVRNLTVMETRELEIYHLAHVIEELNGKTSDEIKAIFDDLAERESSLRSAMEREMVKLAREWKKLPPLDRLRQQGKPLSMLHLKGGEKIAGSVLRREGKKVVVDTGDGVVKVPADDIIRRLNID